MLGKISADEALARNDLRYIDLRSPSEFAQGSIPQAINLPLFSDEEKALLGKVYRTQGRRQAFIQGLNMASPRLPLLLQAILRDGKTSIPLVYCWRGGRRSETVSQALRLLEVPSLQLEGGYQSFRRWVLHALGEGLPSAIFIVLHGFTGSGKTKIIHLLSQEGFPSLDLEGIARHRGSVFGSIGITAQPNQKNFDGALALALRKHAGKPYIFVENEGKRIGKLIIPDALRDRMSTGAHLLLQVPLQARARRLAEDYGSGPGTAGPGPLKESIGILRKKLGNRRVETLLALVDKGQFTEAARILCCSYYDPLYRDAHQDKNAFARVIDSSDLRQAAAEAAAFAEMTCQDAGASFRERR